MNMVYIVRKWHFKKGFEDFRFDRHSAAVECIDTLLQELPDNARIGLYAEVPVNNLFGEPMVSLIEIDHMRTVKQLKDLLEYD